MKFILQKVYFDNDRTIGISNFNLIMNLKKHFGFKTMIFINIFPVKYLKHGYKIANTNYKNPVFIYFGTKFNLKSYFYRELAVHHVFDINVNVTF